MSEEACLECTFLIPVLRNSDRRPHQPIVWRDFTDELRAVFSGSTERQKVMVFRDISTVRGEWEGIEDESRRYTIALPEDRVAELRDFLRRQRERFDQKAIYLSVAGKVEFL